MQTKSKNEILSVSSFIFRVKLKMMQVSETVSQDDFEI